MSSSSHFFRFWGVVFGASILLIPQLVFAANPVSKTDFTKDTSTGTALWERQITSCAPTSNVTPRATGDCDDSAPSATRTSDNDPVYATVVVNDPSTVDCADFEGQTTGVSVDAVDAAGVVNDGGVLHFDLATEYGQSYDTYEACANTTPESTVAGNYFITKGWSWNDNLGWVSFVCDSSQFNAGISCGDITYKTALNTSTGVFSGYAWGDATGWIQFQWECPVGYSAAQCDDNRVTLDFATGELSGYAWSENVGWFNFDGVNINNSDLTSLWQYSSTTVDWDVEVYYGKPYTELFADCTDAYKVHVRFKDSNTGTYLDPETSGYTVSVSDWTEDDTVEYDQVDSNAWTSTYYPGDPNADCPVNSEDAGYWQEEDIYHYVIEGFTVAVLDSTNAVVLKKDFTWDETQFSTDGTAYGHFAFYPVVTGRNLCVNYSGTKKPYITAGAGTGKTVTSSFDKRSSAVSVSSIELIGKLFSPTDTLLYSTTSTTTETTPFTFSGTTYSYTTTIDIDTEGGNGCYIIRYTIVPPATTTPEIVEVPVIPIPRYVPYGVGIPQFETRGTQSTETDVDTATVTRNTLYTTLKKVLGASTGKITDSTLKSADLDGDPRTANDSAEFLGGNLLYFSGGADVYFDDSGVSAVSAGMNFTDVDDLVSSSYAITWTEPITIVVEAGDVYILDNLWGDAPLGIIVLDDGAGSRGNVYIGKDVTNVKAVIYADGFATSYDPDQGIDSAGTPIFSAPTRDEALTSQLYFVGSIISGENTTTAIDSDGDGTYSDDELDASDEEKAVNLNWMREFKLYPETSADGNPEDYDGDGTVEDCSTVTGYPYINASVDCDDAFSSESGTLDGDLIVRDEDYLAAGVTEDATSLYSVVDFLPFYLRYQAPDSALPIFRSTGGGGSVGQ